MPIFIASPTDVLQGDEAAQRLRETNDTRFVGEHGIIAVDEARWQLAQNYERQTWLIQGIGLQTDRAEAHRAAFNGYVSLPAHLGMVLELGCGVFTVTRDILAQGHTADHITLVDPLASEYQSRHPYCSYQNGNIVGVAAAVKAQAIEAVDFGGQRFDTVVLVNVLSHCRDAQRVLDVAESAVKPGGYIVFQETVHQFDPADVWDAGHPLRPSQAFVDAFLARFEEVYRGEGNYFVGEKGLGIKEEKGLGDREEGSGIRDQELAADAQSLLPNPQSLIPDLPEVEKPRRGRKPKK